MPNQAKQAVLDELDAVVEALNAKISNIPPGEDERRKLIGQRNRVTSRIRKIDAATFKANTSAFQTASQNLKKVVANAKADMKQLVKIGAIITTVSRVVLAAEQVLLAAV